MQEVYYTLKRWQGTHPLSRPRASGNRQPYRRTRDPRHRYRTPLLTVRGIEGRRRARRKAAGGKPNTLSVENQLLMMLEYWREYRIYFHIGQAYGIGESAAYRNIKWCENTLAKSKSFRLPGRKAVAASDRAFDVVLIDATETPIERPKKTTALLFGQEEAAHAKNAACCREINAPHSMHCAKKDDGTTSGCSRGQRFVCILKRKPLSTAAIKACRECTPTRRCEEAQQKESVSRNRQGQKPRYLQRTRALRERHRHAQTLQDYR
jgi:hypothetical protein